jgi:hypothetical protein
VVHPISQSKAIHRRVRRRIIEGTCRQVSPGHASGRLHYLHSMRLSGRPPRSRSVRSANQHVRGTQHQDHSPRARLGRPTIQPCQHEPRQRGETDSAYQTSAHSASDDSAHSSYPQDPVAPHATA